jgi:hypothetical protein
VHRFNQRNQYSAWPVRDYRKRPERFTAEQCHSFVILINQIQCHPLQALVAAAKPCPKGGGPVSSIDRMPTRLWLTSPHFYPTYGGAQNRYRSYIPGLPERGLDVQIMTGTPLLEERTESNTQADWYHVDPGEWLPASTLDGAPLERIRLPDSKKRARTQIYPWSSL